MPKPRLKRLLATAALVAVAYGRAGCAKQQVGGRHSEGTVPDNNIEAVLQQHTPGLMSLPGVLGTAVGLCERKLCIKVLVVRKTAELRGRIPSTLEGFPVVIEETGEFRALDST